MPSRIPPATTQVGHKTSVVQEIPPEDFGYAENEMSVRNGLEDFFAKPLAEFHHPFLMT